MNKDNESRINLSKESAESLIESIRTLLATEKQRSKSGEFSKLARAIENMMHKQYNIPPLSSCFGEAHSNPYIDACNLCAPRWGFLGDKVTVARLQRKK